MVDNATQIKSATNNIGTFSPAEEKIQFSRESSSDTITMSKGEAAKNKARYKSDKVYSKKEIQEYLSSISVFDSLPARERLEFVENVWRGLNGEKF